MNDTLEDLDVLYENAESLQLPLMEQFLMTIPCLEATINQTIAFQSILIVYNFTFLLFVKCFVKKYEKCCHISSAVLGLALLYHMHFNEIQNYQYFVGLLVISYVLVYLFGISNKKYCTKIPIGFTIGTGFIAILISGEFYYLDHDAWRRCRGFVMVAMMKIISIAFEHENGKKLPDLVQFSGYMLCPANSVLGPWISFKEYRTIYNKNHTINHQWFLAVIKYVIGSLIFVCCSNCFISFLIPEDCSQFFLAFKDALSFRTSHYFISSLSSATMVMAGYKDKDSKNGQWSYTVTSPAEIEIPRSMLTVVMYWNVPMHRFLKKYIFNVCLPAGSFIAIVTTYFLSALLHGLSIEVSIVLLTLGIFSYVQNKFQNACAFYLKACVRARPCKECSHIFKKEHLMTRFINFAFTIKTILYLAYIGCLMETLAYDEPNPWIRILVCLDNWARVGYFGHLLVISTLILSHIFDCLSTFAPLFST